MGDLGTIYMSGSDRIQAVSFSEPVLERAGLAEFDRLDGDVLCSGIGLHCGSGVNRTAVPLPEVVKDMRA